MSCVYQSNNSYRTYACLDNLRVGSQAVVMFSAVCKQPRNYYSGDFEDCFSCTLAL